MSLPAGGGGIDWYHGRDQVLHQPPPPVRAFSKLLWLQNDLINRHYAAERVLAEAA